ncbi:MAG: response regulator transcription factor [Lachnospiraceae bacterium]|nr:response regulator transcription factor [Lachnospiraceae bacterium]
MLKIYICEDIAIQRQRIKEIIENVIVMESIDFKIACVADNPYEILQVAKRSEDVGIYFLDIDLGTNMDGLELAKRIRAYDPRGFIIFITTHSEMSYLTFLYKLEAMDFILKDWDDAEVRERVYQCMLDAHERVASRKNHVQDTFHVKVNDRQYHIPYDDILFFETSKSAHKIILHGKNRIMEFYGKIKDLENSLDDRFYRCHCSYLINKHNIEEIDYEAKIIYLNGGEECEMSTRMMRGLKRWLKK